MQELADVPADGLGARPAVQGVGFRWWTRSWALGIWG